MQGNSDSKAPIALCLGPADQCWMRLAASQGGFPLFYALTLLTSDLHQRFLLSLPSPREKTEEANLHVALLGSALTFDVKGPGPGNRRSQGSAK